MPLGALSWKEFFSHETVLSLKTTMLSNIPGEPFKISSSTYFELVVDTRFAAPRSCLQRAFDSELAYPFRDGSKGGPIRTVDHKPVDLSTGCQDDLSFRSEEPAKVRTEQVRGQLGHVPSLRAKTQLAVDEPANGTGLCS